AVAGSELDVGADVPADGDLRIVHDGPPGAARDPCAAITARVGLPLLPALCRGVPAGIRLTTRFVENSAGGPSLWMRSGSKLRPSRGEDVNEPRARVTVPRDRSRYALTRAWPLPGPVGGRERDERETRSDAGERRLQAGAGRVVRAKLGVQRGEYLLFGDHADRLPQRPIGLLRLPSGGDPYPDPP